MRQYGVHTLHMSSGSRRIFDVLPDSCGGAASRFATCIFFESLMVRARPLRPVLRIDELAAEPVAELLCVFAPGKAEEIEIRAVAIESVTAVAERQALAEETNGQWEQLRRPHGSAEAEHWRDWGGQGQNHPRREEAGVGSSSRSFPSATGAGLLRSQLLASDFPPEEPL